MPRLAIIDHIVSAGGVERFLHGLIGGAIEERITDNWEIVLVRNWYNSAHRHIPWPQHLQTPNLRLEYLTSDNPIARCLNKLASANRRIFGIPGTGFLQRRLAAAVRSVGPECWRAYCGESRAWIEHFCRRNRFDVVYFSYPFYLEPPRLNIPLVSTPHDFTFKHGLSTTNAISRMLDRQTKRWLEACSQVVVSSEFIANDLRRFYPEWKHKARVIRLGIPSAEHLPTPDEVETFRRNKALPERFIMTAGWMVEHKNQQVVFEAIAKLRDRGVRIPLVVVGPNADTLNGGNTHKPGPYVLQILQFCKEAGLQNGVDYISLGFVNDFELECLYRSAMMLIAPTITEAGSFPAREAMRCGCPVAFSRIPAFEEEMGLIQSNAWMFPTHDSDALADVISEITRNPDEAHRRATAAQQIVQNVFCWKNTAREYFSVFEEVAGLKASQKA